MMRLIKSNKNVHVRSYSADKQPLIELIWLVIRPRPVNNKQMIKIPFLFDLFCKASSH